MAAQAAADQPAAAQDDAVVTPPDMVSDVARPMVQRVRAEAVSLLQLVRDLVFWAREEEMQFAANFFATAIPGSVPAKTNTRSVSL